MLSCVSLLAEPACYFLPAYSSCSKAFSPALGSFLLRLSRKTPCLHLPQLQLWYLACIFADSLEKPTTSKRVLNKGVKWISCFCVAWLFICAYFEWQGGMLAATHFPAGFREEWHPLQAGSTGVFMLCRGSWVPAEHWSRLVLCQVWCELPIHWSSKPVTVFQYLQQFSKLDVVLLLTDFT